MTILETQSVVHIDECLDLVEGVFLRSGFNCSSFENVILIGAQHILPTTRQMLQSLFVRGLAPGKTFLVGKCYSTDYTTFSLMRKQGVHVCSSSINFSRSRSFDEVYAEDLQLFIDKIVSSVPNIEHYKIIVLDDGGQLLSYLNSLSIAKQLNIVGVEQTTSGYEKLRLLDLNFVVTNVARSFAKLHYESKVVVSTAVKSLIRRIEEHKFSPKKVLIYGNGALGGALASALEGRYNVTTTDLDQSRSDLPYLESLKTLEEYDLIAGCVGKEVLTKKDIQRLKPGAVLVSLSSSDREFDIVGFRKDHLIDACHEDFDLPNGVRVLNCGFPINFCGNSTEVDVAQFELTRGLLVLGILQAMDSRETKGIIALDEAMQSELIHSYLKKYS